MIEVTLVSHLQVMKYINKLLLTTIICIFTSLTIFGQNISIYRQQHQKLLANQTRITERIDWRLKQEHYKKTFESELFERELFERELFELNWDNEKLNPYSTEPTIGERIDIRSYVNPVRTNVVNSHYGYRSRFGRNHYGIDLKASIGDTIYAAFSGKIRLTKFDRGGYGFYVVIRHENKLETLYGHLSRFLVKENQYVKEGEAIGIAGNTGRSTGPHLHFEFRYNGKCINPEKLIDFETHSPLTGFYTYAPESNRKNINVASNRTVRKHKKRR